MTYIKYIYDDFNEIVIERMDKDVYRICIYDPLFGLEYELAHYTCGKYTILNEELFNEMFIGYMKKNPDVANEYYDLIRPKINRNNMVSSFISLLNNIFNRR